MQDNSGLEHCVKCNRHLPIELELGSIRLICCGCRVCYPCGREPLSDDDADDQPPESDEAAAPTQWGRWGHHYCECVQCKCPLCHTSVGHLSLSEAFFMTIRHAQQGRIWAMLMVASHHFMKGRGIPESPERAYYWVRKAAEEHEYPLAWITLANHLSDGIGCTKDRQEALMWIRRAAETGYGLAFRAMAHYLMDEHKAIDASLTTQEMSLLCVAADKASAQAHMDLGAIYRNTFYGHTVGQRLRRQHALRIPRHELVDRSIHHFRIAANYEVGLAQYGLVEALRLKLLIQSDWQTFSQIPRDSDIPIPDLSELKFLPTFGPELCFWLRKLRRGEEEVNQWAKEDYTKIKDYLRRICNNRECGKIINICKCCRDAGKERPEHVTKSRMCAGCRCAFYCSRDCQRKHWKASEATGLLEQGHKVDCKASFYDDSLMYQVKTPATPTSSQIAQLMVLPS
ncbi:hypothetical protein BC830DRAFT_450209 [Chytriomyces sp. MP71]|nr:hypothetical protein BC830DRAFT_450209 [Chytriomyces sp. MP71]